MHGILPVSSPYKAERQAALAPPARFPCDQGRERGAGPARGGWPLPACGEPMRINPHKVEVSASKRPPESMHVANAASKALSIRLSG